METFFGAVLLDGGALEILSLARLARSQDERVTMLLDPVRGIYEGSSTLQIDPRTLFSDSRTKSAI
jgi:hypothetical protein